MAPQRIFARLGAVFVCSLGSFFLSSCAFFEAEPVVPNPIAATGSEFTGPKTFEEEFSTVRFLDAADGLLSAMLTVPKGSGENFKEELIGLCSCLGPDNEPGSATLRVVKNGGGVYDNKLIPENLFPWMGEGSYKAVEDILVATGSEDDLREIFAALDIWFNSGPQISIEAVVTENLNNDSFERGMTQVGTDPLFQDAQSSAFLRSIGGNFPTSTNPTTSGAGIGGAFQVGLIDSSFQLDAVLQFLEKKGLVQVVSQPKIVTRNGVTATVESIEEIPFLNVTTLSLSGAATFKIDSKSVGVKMHVTPFLVGVDTIHLVIDVEVSRLGQDFVIGTDGNNQQIVAPSLNTRKASTEVYVRNGTHVLIGGLELTEDRVSESKVPLLGDLPLLGWLFSSRSVEKVKTTVTFMFTPKIKLRPSIDPFGDYYDPFEDVDNAE